jgi:hypothetical protein
MTGAQVEYVGYQATEASRDYNLRVRQPGQPPVQFVVCIPNEAFLVKRVRYQDAPEVCFLKLQRELQACAEGGLPAERLVVTDADLEEYRAAHAPKAPTRRAKPVVETTEAEV